MDKTKYVGMDVHKETISVAVVNSTGKLVKEVILETKVNTILEFILGLRRNVHVTFKEGTWAAWLYDLLKPHVANVVVCNPRKNALLNDGNKGDETDARKLAELLRGNFLRRVYHGETGTRTLKELTRGYIAISKDLVRVMNRIKALYRSRGIACAGILVYAPRHRSEWLARITDAGGRRRAELFYHELDALQSLRQEAMARLTLARKIAAITWIIWKKGVSFDAQQLKPQAARASLIKDSVITRKDSGVSQLSS